jgi:hypothetical protein
MERLVNVTFGVHVSPDDIETWLATCRGCGVVRADPEDERRYVVTVRRSGAMEYLEIVLAGGVKLGVLAWHAAAL